MVTSFINVVFVILFVDYCFSGIILWWYGGGGLGPKYFSNRIVIPLVLILLTITVFIIQTQKYPRHFYLGCE